MDAEQVVDKILSEARAEAEAIRSEAQGQADEDRSRLQEELDAFEAETKRLADQAAEDRRARMLAAARMENRKAELTAKVELLNEVFEKAAERLAALEDDEYRDFMADLMARAVETGDEKIIVGRDETRIDDRVIKAVNRQLGPGFKGNLQLASDRADIRGGFILRRGKIQTNVSIDVLVGQTREDMEPEVVAMLFGAPEPQAESSSETQEQD
ncbi:MAG TPA: hypothetical protein ENN87_07185 [Phycisphaerales bacterium]|nr:hypothetical protein [Phycisphaerales bacterium]